MINILIILIILITMSSLLLKIKYFKHKKNEFLQDKK